MSKRDGYWETNPDKAAHAHALWEEGLSASAIGRVFGVSKNAICGLKNRQGTWTRRESPIRPPRPDVGVRQQQRRIGIVRVASVKLPPLLALLDDPILLTTPPRERPPKPKPVIEAPRPVQQSTRQCEYLTGDKPFVRCADRAVFGYPYCESHCRACYINLHGAALDEVEA
jgi:hypothetical protein